MSKKNIRRILGRIFEAQFIAPNEIPLAFERAHLQKLFSLLKVEQCLMSGQIVGNTREC